MAGVLVNILRPSIMEIDRFGHDSPPHGTRCVCVMRGCTRDRALDVTEPTTAKRITAMTYRTTDLGLAAALRIYGFHPTRTTRESTPSYPSQQRTVFYYQDTGDLRTLVGSYESGALEGSLNNFHAILRAMQNQIRDARREEGVR